MSSLPRIPTMLDGIPVFTSEYLPRTRWVQYRRPRTKRRRIQNKVARRYSRKFWREVDCSLDLYLRKGGPLLATGIYGRPEAIENLKRQLEGERNSK